MRTKRQLKDRRQRLRELAERDAANRCAHCRIALNGLIFESFLTPGRFCSDGCLKAAITVAQLKGDGC